MPARPGPHAGKVSRRSHRKSRLGCGNCKRRRVKWDEMKPSCGNCLRHSIDCDYALHPEITSIPSTEGEVSPTSLIAQRQLRLRFLVPVQSIPPKRGPSTHPLSTQQRDEPNPQLHRAAAKSRSSSRPLT